MNYTNLFIDSFYILLFSARAYVGFNEYLTMKVDGFFNECQ